MAGSGDYMRLEQCRPGHSCPECRVGSHRALRGPDKARRGVRGLSTPASFSRLAVLHLCSCTSPLDSSGSDSFVHPFPLLPLLSFFLPLSNYLLVSSPAGRSFFEKTTRARTRPTLSHKKYRSLPHPNRRYSSTFVCIFPSISICQCLFFTISFNFHPLSLHVPNLLPFPVIRPCLRLHILGFLSIPSELTSTYILHPILSL